MQQWSGQIAALIQQLLKVHLKIMASLLHEALGLIPKDLLGWQQRPFDLLERHHFLVEVIELPVASLYGPLAIADCDLNDIGLWG